MSENLRYRAGPNSGNRDYGSYSFRHRRFLPLLSTAGIERRHPPLKLNKGTQKARPDQFRPQLTHALNVFSSHAANRNAISRRMAQVKSLHEIHLHVF